MIKEEPRCTAFLVRLRGLLISVPYIMKSGLQIGVKYLIKRLTFNPECARVIIIGVVHPPGDF
jgi:hypothetical protein